MKVNQEDEEPSQRIDSEGKQVEQSGERRETQAIYDWVDKLLPVCGQGIKCFGHCICQSGKCMRWQNLLEYENRMIEFIVDNMIYYARGMTRKSKSRPGELQMGF